MYRPYPSSMTAPRTSHGRPPSSHARLTFAPCTRTTTPLARFGNASCSRYAFAPSSSRTSTRRPSTCPCSVWPQSRADQVAAQTANGARTTARIRPSVQPRSQIKSPTSKSCEGNQPLRIWSPTKRDVHDRRRRMKWSSESASFMGIKRRYAICVPTIRIRNVPDDVHRRLKDRAMLAGVSVSDYAIALLTRSLERPTQAEVLDRLAAPSAARESTSRSD
jgi:antitoxin FitA